MQILLCRLLELNGGSRYSLKKKKRERQQFGNYYADISDYSDVQTSKGKSRDVFRQTNTYETLRVECEINGHPMHAVIDTGAQISIMSTMFAKRCELYSSIDRRFAGRAVGVGSSEILGRSTPQVRLGAMQFKSDFSVLENTRVDLIIGLDILRKYQCNVCLRENVVKFHYHNKVFRVPIITQSSPMVYDTERAYDKLSLEKYMDQSNMADQLEAKTFYCEDEENGAEEDENYEAVSMEGW